MADSHLLADLDRVSRVDVQHRAVLNVAAGADADSVLIGADDDAEPDTDVLFQSDGSDHRSVGGDELRTMKPRLALAESIDHASFFPFISRIATISCRLACSASWPHRSRPRIVA